MKGARRWSEAVWLAALIALAALHALHLRADFPNHSPWFSDWAKYTDEGWYGNAAVRSHLFGHWYMAHDFNPAAALPVWPALEWVVFAFAGVRIEAARALAVSFFFLNLGLSYLLVRSRWPRWAGMLAITLIVASPFLYAFSRLAILEPVLTTLTLLALNIAVRMERWRSPERASAIVGLIFALMMLTKTTAIFLLPALAWAMAAGLKRGRKPWLRCGIVAAACATFTYGLWLAVIAHAGLMTDYRYLFDINHYEKPKERIWPLMSLYWSFHGALWVDRVLIPLAGIVAIGAALARKQTWATELLQDPVFGASFWAMTGYILFMTYQNHPQPRYFAVIAFFAFILISVGVASAARSGAAPCFAAIAISVSTVTAAFNAVQTVRYAMHPEYTFVQAAQRLTDYVDAHPNGRRMLLSISGDEITMMTHLPSMCDDFGTVDLTERLDDYQPGWYAVWNDIDPGALADIHTRYSLEQVDQFPALDDPDRNLLVLFKLHRLPDGKIRGYSPETLAPMADDKIEIPME